MQKSSLRAWTRGLFVATLAVALVGGLGLIVVQAVGLIAGSGAVLDAPNGVVKNVLCICASVAAVAAYALSRMKPAEARS